MHKICISAPECHECYSVYFLEGKSGAPCLMFRTEELHKRMVDEIPSVVQVSSSHMSIGTPVDMSKREVEGPQNNTGMETRCTH